MEESSGKLAPALIGGSVMAVLSWIPVIAMGNCLCCMWILLGGAAGAFWYRKKSPPGASISGGEAAMVGLLSGIFGALFHTFLTYAFLAVTGLNLGQGFLETLIDNAGTIPAEIEDLLLELREEGMSPLFVFAGLFISIIVNSLFGMIGAILYVSLTEKKNAPEKAGRPPKSTRTTGKGNV